MMKGNFLKRSCFAAFLAGYTGFLSFLNPISANAVNITGPGVNTSLTSSSVGPGYNTNQSASTNTTSPDAADYASTNGVAAGTMTISTYTPPGCISALPLNVDDPVVVTKDKYSYEDLTNDLARLSEKYPSLMSYQSLGKTADNREIYEAIVGNPKASTQVLITASIHAREYITTLLCMKQMEYILAFADNGAFDGKKISDWLNDVCFRFVPMINPDGVTLSQFGIDGVGSQALKNTIGMAYLNDYSSSRTTLDFATYLTRWKANLNGVNLNDNFASPYFEKSTITSQVSSDSYYGEAGSEAETIALQNLVNSVHFKAVINYHATGSVIYWNYEGNPLVEHSRDLSNNIWALTGYRLISSGIEKGSFKSYLGSLSNPVTSITIEVGQSQAPVAISEFDRIWSQNIFVPFYTMKWAKEKGK